MTPYREKCSFSLLSPVCCSGEVTNIPHLLVSRKRSQNPSSDCRKERAHGSNLGQGARADGGQDVAPRLLLPQPRRDLLPPRAVSLLASSNFTFV